MKLAHLADIHLGFRQYYRQTPQGINQREADVAGAFRAAVTDMAEADPDLVVIAGDLFHSVRPTNLAILHAFNQLRRLRDALPETPVVLVAGNHDTPRSVETGSILQLFEAVGGVHVVTHATAHLTFDRLDTSLLCVPSSAVWGHRPSLLPEATRGHNVLVIHAPVAGMEPWRDAVPELAGSLLEPDELHADRWDYVAMGHYHVAHAVRKNAWYAGALDYVSPNPWGEVAAETREGRSGQKGWLLVELGREAHVEFRPVPLARRVIDLAPIHGAGQEPEALDKEITQRVATVAGGIDDQILRQLVYDVPRPIARDLDYARIREYKTRALHYQLDIRRPAPRREIGVGGPAGKRQTLPEMLQAYLERRPLDAAVERQPLIQLANRYMGEVERELLEE